MKVNVTLPYGYGRAFLSPEKFVRSAPTFNVTAFDDNGNHLQEPYPSKVKFGPEMYDFLNFIMPRIAAARGEDLHYKGKVETKPLKASELEQYAYYGLGENPLRGTENEGVGLIGFGPTPSPRNPDKNFMYSMKMSMPSPNGSTSRSNVLTNILNDSHDFSPLLAPLYKYTDLDYDMLEDEDNKGPKPTDHWVPRVDPVTHQRMFKEDGSPMWMPVPLVQDLPIYNLRHPAWEKAPEGAWNMITDPKSALDWDSWGSAPSFADYTGRTSMTDSGKIRTRDYAMHNAKMLDRRGYFEDWPELKAQAHNLLTGLKGKRSLENITTARKEEAKKFEQQMAQENAEKKQERFYRPDDAKHTGFNNQANSYKTLIHRSLQNPDLLAKFNNISKDDEKGLKKFIMQPGSFSKYNQHGSDEDKIIAIFNDYSDKKSKDSTTDNILAGVKEPFNG